MFRSRETNLGITLFAAIELIGFKPPLSVLLRLSKTSLAGSDLTGILDRASWEATAW
jgi:hypothetical protein